MADRQFYTMKFKSSRLKEFNYNIDISFDEAKELGEIIALSDNQILRSIRKITDKHVDLDKVETLYTERDRIKNKPSSKENSMKIQELQSQINDMMFIPEYITIVMEHNSHYKYLFNNGLMINFYNKDGRDKELVKSSKFVRLSCSAGQARVSTVVFCEEVVAEKLKDILNNGRDLSKELVPSKFNAYLGVSGSATKNVSSPRFCVVPDYESETYVKVNFVTETEWDEDDHIEVKTIPQNFNRFDGQGLISYEMASKWAEELGLDYVPATWCIRNSFLKGMLVTFRIHDFCDKINNKNYKIKTSYKDENGDCKIVDLKRVDAIISESMFKLWDSFDSIEAYEENCKNNGLAWGVSLYNPKQESDILKMNYQFLQTLRLNQNDIEKLCNKFVNWIEGVTFKNIYYTLLFLLGKNTTEGKINKFLNKSNNYWVKSLIADHSLINDKYIRTKIYELIKKRIKKGCLGEIIVNGNFQTIISDPFAMMQHVCGLEVTGLLKKKEYYSNYWNEKGVKIVDSMRAPLTYRSEHLKLNLVDGKVVIDNEEFDLNYWYEYCTSGIILNVHGVETLHYAGSDFDFDILATTSDPVILKGVYEDELPVVYEPPKPKKKLITEEDLYNADLFAFGSCIGAITNKSTSGFALLPLLDDNSKEYNATMSRIKMCTKLQSAQIDKAKLGREVKGIPKKWIERQKIEDGDNEEIIRKKEFLNKILLDKHPYFFIYLYKDTKSKYTKHVNGYNVSCQQKFNMTLRELLNKKRKTEEEGEFIAKYNEFMPVIDSDCVMNNLCKYIESVDFNIKNKIDIECDEDIYTLYMSDNEIFNDDVYNLVKQVYHDYNKSIEQDGNLGIHEVKTNSKHSDEVGVKINSKYDSFRNKMTEVCSNTDELINYLVKLFYIDIPSSNKNLLWNTYGKELFENIKRKNENKVLFPFPSMIGEIEYLGNSYELREVSL